jgi:hypothetical protein
MKRIELLIDEDENTLDFISLVEEPAIEVDFFYFNKEGKKQAPKLFKFEETDTDKRIVTGPAMIPDLDIPRIDENGDVYMVYFSKETVRQAAEIFFKKSNPNETNINHNDEVMKDVTVFESWIVDKDNNKGGGKNFEDIPDGTWMVSYKIDNDEIWEDFIKTGKIKGFSVEGSFVFNDVPEDHLYEMISELVNDGIRSEDEIYDTLKKLLS